MACADEFLSDEPDIPESDPVRKFILLVLWQAQTDNATELIIGKLESTGVHVRYKVDDRWYTLCPFPAKIRPDVVRQLQAMAGMIDEAKEGTLDETAGNARLKWSVRHDNSRRRAHPHSSAEHSVSLCRFTANSVNTFLHQKMSSPVTLCHFQSPPVTFRDPPSNGVHKNPCYNRVMTTVVCMPHPNA